MSIAIEAQLRALRATAVSLLAQIDALIIGQPAPSEEPRATDAPCAHPKDQRLSAAVMGAPDAFVCGACGANVSREIQGQEEVRDGG